MTLPGNLHAVGGVVAHKHTLMITASENIAAALTMMRVARDYPGLLVSPISVFLSRSQHDTKHTHDTVVPVRGVLSVQTQ